MKDFFWRPYKPQMGFTATGRDVTSSGGSLGGDNVSLMFCTNERYNGSSISDARSLARWSSGLVMKGLLGCDKSAILTTSSPQRATAYRYWTSNTTAPLLRLEKQGTRAFTLS